MPPTLPQDSSGAWTSGLPFHPCQEARFPTSLLGVPAQGLEPASPLSFWLTDDDSSESGSANGLPALTSPEALAVAGNPPDGAVSYGEVRENGVSAPLDFSTT